MSTTCREETAVPVDYSPLTEHLTALRDNIARYFDLGELRTLSLELNIDFDELSGQTKTEKVQGLVTYLERRGRIPALIEHLKKQRTNADWDVYQPADGQAEPPFKGLQYFDEADAHLFFGREKLTAELVDYLRQHRFLVVVGASGSGKSSVVRAGIIPWVKKGAVEWNGQHSDTWPVHVITPGDEPLKALAATLTRDSESVRATVNLLDDLQKSNLSLDLFLYRQLAGQPHSHLLLVVDQFEELFTQCDNPDERRLFVENLINAIQSGKQGWLSVVLTLRADFYTYALQYEAMRSLLETRQKIVGAMSQEELRRAIEGPAEWGGWNFQSGLVETMLQDVGHEPGALPLLSHALYETWERRQGRLMTLAGYQAAGRISRAIATTADAVYISLTPMQQSIARNIFLRLTELGEGTETTRRRAMLTELVPEGEAATEVQQVLDLLARRRLVTVNEEGLKGNERQSYAEVVHEALVREWPILREWLDENREGVRIHRQLTEAALEWQARGHDAGYLYRGGRLVQVCEWAEKNGKQLNKLEQLFLATSQQAVEQEAAEREAQYQRELEQARQLAEAERQARFRTFGVLGITIFLVFVLSTTPIRNEWYRRQAQKVTMIEVPGGIVQLGQENVHEDPSFLSLREYQIEDFKVEAYEVTNQRYNFCVSARVCSPPNLPRSAYTNPDRQQYPVVSVTAIQAREFCQWIDRELPNDIQWEWSARYPEGRLWPWGDQSPSPFFAFMPYGLELDDAQEVGSIEAGKSELGIYDLVGNVWEWTRTDYSTLTEWNNGQDPPEVLSVRGGGFIFSIENISRRFNATATFSFEFVGFRCIESD